MPYNDPAKKREFARVWAASRRQDWVASHQCKCGAQATSMWGRNGRIPKVWSCSEATRNERLAGVVIDYFCDVCLTTKRNVNKERDRTRELERRKERRAADRLVQGESGDAPKRQRSTGERRIRAEQPIPVFMGSQHYCKHCDDSFPRLGLLVRHQKVSGHAA